MEDNPTEEQLRLGSKVPATAEWLGFVVHKPETREFLASVEHRETTTRIGWSLAAYDSIRYTTYAEARTIAGRCGPKAVGGALFVDGERVLFLSPDSAGVLRH